MNPDLFTADLKKGQKSSQSFWLLGQPDVSLQKQPDGKFIASVMGFDYYDPITNELKSGDKNKIAAWMLDTDYDQRSLFPSQVFLPLSNKNNGWHKLAKTLQGQVDEQSLKPFYGTTSLPFEAGKYKTCAIKIIDNQGVESLCIKSLL